MAPTTQTEVDRVVKDSHFHDDALCQMLDAARMNAVGEEARRALRHAARQRVVQLKDLHTAGKVSSASGQANDQELPADHAPSTVGQQQPPMTSTNPVSVIFKS
jgi:hypothetical protein